MEENTSGRGKLSSIPAEIKGWNWGAFWLTWIWGIGNSAYRTFLVFIPILNFVMPFVCGAKGNVWAWSNRRWESVEQFKKTQRKWAIAGFLIVPGFVALMFLPFTFGLKSTDVYNISLEHVRASERVQEAVGTPIETGYFVSGSWESNGAEGKAALNYSIAGPKDDGEVYVYATKHNGKWKIDELTVVIPRTGEEIVLVSTSGKRRVNI